MIFLSARLRALLPLAITLGLGHAAPSGPLDWPEPARDARPWTFNWWPGSAVDKDNLARELRRQADAGLGGIHIIPIYGAKGAEARAIPYLSPQWLEMLEFATTEGRRLGLGVDMTTGTGWCFGGPSITPDLGGRKVLAFHGAFPKDGKLPAACRQKGTTVQVSVATGPDGTRVPLADKLRADGSIGWTPPAEGWTLSVLGHAPTGQKVKRASPGGEGLMLNPFDPASMRAFLGGFAVFDQPGVARPRAMYHDSYEYYKADWAPGLPDAFAKRRGYRLEDELAAFTGSGDPDRVARVRCDYRETLSDLLVEDVFPLWTGWCRERGMKTRNQAHGAPANLLDFYALADIPETEMFGHGGPDPLVSRYDEHLGKADRNPLISKFASSAAHTTGKPLVSAETGTWLAEHFCESFGELKGLLDLMFLSGVNHVFYHGCAYSPDDAAWPGWLFYAATEMNPRNPLWREAGTLNQYITRSQTILQSGLPDNDVLLYWPVHDTWGKGGFFQFTVHDSGWLTGEPVGKAAEYLWQAGYGFDYVSDRLLEPLAARDGQLRGKDGAAWKVLVVPAVPAIPLPTLRKLIDLAAAGATVVFENDLPRDVPGLHDLDARRAALRDCLARLQFGAASGGVRVARLGDGRILTGPLDACLRASGQARESLVDAPGLKFLRRSHADGKSYFIVNHSMTTIDGWIPLSSPAEAVAAMDPLGGQTGMADTRRRPDGTLEVAARIEPGHSLVLRTFSSRPGEQARFPAVASGAPLLAIPGPWHVKFVSGGPTLPAAYRTDRLDSWTKRDDPALAAFSGTAVYQTEFALEPGRLATLPAALSLDLGRVLQVARVKLNGRDLGGLIMPPFRVPVPRDCLKESANTLEVEVTNLGANRLRDLDLRKVPWRIFHDINFVSITYKPFDASAWPTMESGLLGPVQLLGP